MNKMYIANLLITTVLIFGCVPEKKYDVTCNRSEETSTLKIGKRHRAVKTPMIYARIQPYDLYSNYLHRWLDRPLFLDRTLREGPNYRANGFLSDIKLLAEYDIDGFTFLGDSYTNRYKNYLGIIRNGKPKNFKFMPGMAWRNAYVPRTVENFKRGLASAYSPRIDGKVPFFPYGGASADKIRKFRGNLKRDGLEDALLLNVCWLNIFGEYNKDKALSSGTVSKMKKTIQDKLDVVDGLVFLPYNMHRDPKGEYTLKRQFSYDLNERFVEPVFQRVYDNPSNAKKLLGFDIRHGYINHMAGTNEAELGTKQLRDAMDIALLFNPDIISLVEWNEANENTSFQPTVYNSKSLQRIIKFYIGKLKGIPPTANTGDDASIPNMIVSIRQVLGIGEKYRIELLNVPDTNENLTYSVRLTLRDQNGAVIKRFAADTFNARNLTAVTYTMPTEQIPDTLAVIPELEIHTAAGRIKIIDNLQYTRLVPSGCWNYKEVRQPLRDLLSPSETTFNVRKLESNGEYEVTGSIKLNEPLVSVEVLNREEEVFAIDKSDEFRLKNNVLISLTFSTKKGGVRDVSISVPNVNDFMFKPWSYPYAGFGKWKKEKDTVTGKLLFFGHGAKMLLSIPKKERNAEIKITVEDGETISFPLAGILEKKAISWTLPELTTLNAALVTKLADHPVPLMREDASFSTVVHSDYKLPCFQLRAITKSGKIYRSHPIFPGRITEKIENMNLFSCSQGKAVRIKVQSDRIASVDYKFSQKHGAMLCDPVSPTRDAYLGGGFGYCWPMRFGTPPDGATNTAPSWKKNGDEWCLDFDGADDYVVFPVANSLTGAFSLEFECKTASSSSQVLFRNYSHSGGSITTSIVDGHLNAEFTSMGRNYRATVTKLPLNLAFPMGKWVKISVMYDLKTITFTVDGKKQIIPFKLRANKPTCSIFGGYSSADRDMKDKKIKPNFFKGSLRSFKIRFNAKE